MWSENRFSVSIIFQPVSKLLNNFNYFLKLFMWSFFRLLILFFYREAYHIDLDLSRHSFKSPIKPINLTVISKYKIGVCIYVFMRQYKFNFTLDPIYLCKQKPSLSKISPFLILIMFLTMRKAPIQPGPHKSVLITKTLALRPKINLKQDLKVLVSLFTIKRNKPLKAWFFNGFRANA